jgi:hypothetical protein
MPVVDFGNPGLDARYVHNFWAGWLVKRGDFSRKLEGVTIFHVFAHFLPMPERVRAKAPSG